MENLQGQKPNTLQDSSKPDPPAKKRILLVDDDSAIRYVIGAFLSDQGYEVVTAEDGSRGLSRFLGEPFDLVISDLHMPGMDGCELARRIKDNAPSIPIILMTGSCQFNVCGEENSEILIDEIIPKPFPIADLEKLVAQSIR